MSDEEQVMARPPSSPVITGLLVASSMALLGSISIVYMELTGSYLDDSKPKPVASWDKPKTPLQYANIDKSSSKWAKEAPYYNMDFPKSRSVEDDLNPDLDR